ncbi:MULTISPECIES: class I SAM-dependent methyltransferase [Paenibacillus]|uniref:class I SAM-dependent methyltransferase n=1 Tax=Paenibacillus TaxID=44249 RepID=UPI0022B8A8B9|nr:class I SAM-dependent methyltransferase [Paenibacillus caseinilyticus]MCZ8517929.1 class I SAM-dependent methyltransferase [Paenibacillus caseinilyticus]
MNQDSDQTKKDQVRDQFTRNASRYVTSTTHAKGDDLGRLADWLELQPQWKVLDIATGGGHTAKTLAPLVKTVIAVDLTRPMLETARTFISESYDNVEYVVADAEDLPFLDDTFDAVTCRIAAHHFPSPERFVREAARVLKPGGRLLLIDNVVPDDDALDAFVNRLELLRDESHVRCHRIGEWEEWMRQAGMSGLASRTRKKTFDYTTWVRRTARSEDQVDTVTQHILLADARLQQYIGLVRQPDGAISRIHIDEWMAVARKAGG